MRERIVHCFDPVYESNSRVLILGTMPSPASRENGFYYSHPQNRFWRVISSVFNEPLPITLVEKKELLLRKNIAVWDVIKSCEIYGASDASITKAEPNDIGIILQVAMIDVIIANGSKAYSLYTKFNSERDVPRVIKLPSTSPANAKIGIDKLIAEYGTAMSFLK